MPKKKTDFKFGPLTISARAYASQGNAILGIRDSGKSYTAGVLAEKLFRAGIPFITFDPTGVWRFLRVPGKGSRARGFKIVVVGGKAGDLPLTVATASEIVRAAMKTGHSVVFDLSNIGTKADWKRIVKTCVRVLMDENKTLRHVFIEEAAEFIPQKVIDGDVYAEVERMARIGGNSRLGYTLINQRAQEVNKAVLELCENLFLHRQKGKNAIEALDRWLDAADVGERDAIIKSMAKLPTGECWVWLGGEHEAPPTLVKVPAKQSMHPDRRIMRGDRGAKMKKAVSLGSFVNGMKKALVSVQAEFEANDVVALRAKNTQLAHENARLKAAAAAPSAPAIDRKALVKAEKAAFNRAKAELTKAAERKAHDTVIKALEGARRLIGSIGIDVDHIIGAAMKKRIAIGSDVQFTPDQRNTGPVMPYRLGDTIAFKTGKREKASLHVVTHVAQRKTPALKGAKPAPVPEGFELTNPRQNILDALAWVSSLGNEHAARNMIGFLAGASPKSSAFSNNLGAMKTAGLLTYGAGRTLALTDAGHRAAMQPDRVPTHAAYMEKIGAKLTRPQMAILQAASDVWPSPIDRPTLAERACASVTSSAFSNNCGALKSLGLITYASGTPIRAADRIFPDRRAA